MSERHHTYRWRTGRKVGRTIYAQVGAEPDDTDPLIGVMDTPELAADAVACHNASLLAVQGPMPLAPSEKSVVDHSLRVEGRLHVVNGPYHTPLSVTVGARRGDEMIEISVSIEEHTEWVITVDPPAAAYLAGSLARLAE